MQDPKAARAAEAVILTAGIGATITQLVTAREFLAQFNGSEFVIALNLFVWLTVGGIGAWAAGFVERQENPSRGVCRMGLFALAMAILPPLQIIAIRCLRDQLFLPGTSVGFYPTLGFVLMTSAPYSFAAGYLVPSGLGVLRRWRPGTPAARAYILDNLGNVTGGVLFAFLLVWITSPPTAAVMAGLPILIAVLWMLQRAGRRIITIGIIGSTALGILCGSFIFQSAFPGTRQGRMVLYEETRFGRLTVHRDQGQVTLFRDGRPINTSDDPASAEAAVHYPLALCERPRRILMIGAQAGMLAELEKYRPEEVDYIEIDPAVAQVQFEFGLLKPIASLRVVNQDGRAYLSSNTRRYDAILLSVAEPDTFQINRFFTERFFQLAASHLSPGGVLGFSVQGYANYLTEAQRAKLSILQATARRHFTHVQALPGERVYFLCRQEPIPLDIPERLSEKGIETLYAGPYFYGEIDAWRIEALDTQLDDGAPINSDTSPCLVRILFEEWFEKFATSPWVFTLAVTALAAAYGSRLNAAEYVLMTTGAMLMGGMILAVFAFQVIFGYIYYQLGFIVTVFLAGLLPGALWADRSRHDPRILLFIGDVALVLVMAGFAFSLGWVADRLPSAFFAAFGFLLSLVCGLQFPAAVRLNGDRLSSVAAAFGADLVGAALGALLVSVVVIPYFGFFYAAGLLVVFKLTSLVLTGGRRWKT